MSEILSVTKKNSEAIQDLAKLMAEFFKSNQKQAEITTPTEVKSEEEVVLSGETGGLESLVE
jgi:hypothetical protein